MFKSKKDLFFDLDHTLWDYEKSSRETLNELWVEYRLQEQGIGLEDFLLKFKEVNDALWDKFHAGIIGKEVIRSERFPLILSSLGDEDIFNVHKMQEAYIRQCPTKPYLLEGTLELLDYLKGRYALHILTNGFDEVQSVKLTSGGIINYFDQVITSGSAGSQKPEKAIFKYAINSAKTSAKDSIMIGDNPISDIQGAYEAGIDQVFFNPLSLKCPISPTLEITSLRELTQFL